MRIWLGITRFFIVIVVGVIVLFGVPHFFGIEVFYVSSGSMEPMLRVGDAIFVKLCNLEEIEEQSIVTYSLSQSDVRITHRVLKLDRENGIMLTKGDANDQTDGEWISGDCLIGKVVLHLRWFGNVAYLLSLGFGKLLTVGILLWLLAFQSMLEQWGKPGSRGNKTRRNRMKRNTKKRDE